uniref:Uncharacterized protein n=1 Tax=Acrobeloides nanus TaxID=290746 RepID=A0A914CEN6_9BILA
MKEQRQLKPQRTSKQWQTRLQSRERRSGASNKVYTDNPFETLEALQAKIIEEVDKIPLDMIRAAFSDHKRRLEECVRRNGASVEIC